MKKIITTFSFILIAGMSMVSAQVNSIKYLLKYNCETSLYEVRLKIEEGFATSVAERAQFNSQMTIAVPTGAGFTIVEKYLPIINNQNYNGTMPNRWTVASPVLSPMGNEEFDFYSTSPSLTPASFYNDLEEGTSVMLYTFTAGDSTVYDDRIRFFDNDIDGPKSTYEGADLRNGFSLGGANNKYDGNIHQGCTTNTKDVNESDVKIYPNPADSQLFIDTPANTKSIKMIDTSGRKVKEIKNPKSGLSSFDIQGLDGGIYFIQVDNSKVQAVTIL